MNETLRQIAFDTIKGFAWWNYGLDSVGDAQSDEWAHALADEVVEVVVGQIERAGGQS